LTNGRAWDAVSAFANCGRAVAFVRGSYWPKPAVSRCSNAPLFDHLVGALLQTQGHFDAERDDLSPASAGLFLARAGSVGRKQRAFSQWLATDA
jgi:hypothetical protein